MLGRSYNLWAAIIISLFAILGIVYLNFSFEMPTGRVISSSESYCKEVDVPYVDVEGFTEEVPVQECFEEDVDYFVDGFKIISECLESNNTVCTKKNVYFSVNFRNNDDARGHWALKFSLISDGEVIDSKTLSVDLEAEENSQLSVTFPLIDENADKVVSGEYSVVKEATKQICSGPTVMKNVTKTVSITKFRTEVRCF